MGVASLRLLLLCALTQAAHAAPCKTGLRIATVDFNIEPMLELQPPFLVARLYAPVSPRLLAEHGAFVRQFWRGLCRQSRRHPAQLPACP